MREVLPGCASLALHLTRGHQRNELLKLIRRKIGADMAEAPGYVLAHGFLTKRMNIGQVRLAEGVLF